MTAAPAAPSTEVPPEESDDGDDDDGKHFTASTPGPGFGLCLNCTVVGGRTGWKWDMTQEIVPDDMTPLYGMTLEKWSWKKPSCLLFTPCCGLDISDNCCAVDGGSLL